MTQDLGHEERVSVRLLRDVVRELEARCVHLDARHRRHHLCDLIDLEALQRAALDAVQPVQVRERIGQRMAPVEIRLAVDPQHEQGRVRRRRRHVLEQRQRLAVRPVQVVEHEQQRAVISRPLAMSPATASNSR